MKFNPQEPARMKPIFKHASITGTNEQLAEIGMTSLKQGQIVIVEETGEGYTRVHAQVGYRPVKPLMVPVSMLEGVQIQLHMFPIEHDLSKSPIFQ